MRFLALLFVFLIHGCSCTGVFAQTLSVNTQEVFTGIDSKLNYIKNPFARLNSSGFTSSMSSCTRDASTDKLFGISSWVIDASAQGGYCEFDLKPIQDPHKTGWCEFKGVIKGDASLYRAQILNGSSVVQVQTTPIGDTGSDWRQFSASGPCQATPKVRITGTEAGTHPAIKAGIYYGPATNIGTVSQATAYGGAEQIGGSNCSFLQNTSTGLSDYVDLGTAGSCAQAWTSSGSCVAVGPTSSQISCANMPPGKYQFTVSAAFQTTTASGGSCRFRISDSTNSFGFNLGYTASSGSTFSSTMIGDWEYSSGGNRTFKIQAADDTTSCQLNNGDAGAKISWNIKRFPTSSETVIQTQDMDVPLTTFTPVLSTGAFNPAAITYKFTYSLSGPYMFLNVDYSSATAGTAGSGIYNLTLPGGYEISPTAINPATSASALGSGYAYDGASSEKELIVTANNSTSVSGRFYAANTNSFTALASSTMSLGGTNVRLSMSARIPIKGRENLRPSGVVNIDGPVDQIITLTGSGNFVTPPGVTSIEIIEALGAGGGGGGSGTTSGGAGTAGGNTTFGTSLITANGGAAGSRNGPGGTGGTFTVNAPAILITGVQGANGQGANSQGSSTTAASSAVMGGMGGSSCLGGAGNGATQGNQGGSAKPGSGSGGGGAAMDTTASTASGTGGGAGACVRARIERPTSGQVFPYSVGVGGLGQGAGTSGQAGGLGADGKLVLRLRFSTVNAIPVPSVLETALIQTNRSVTGDGTDKIRIGGITFAGNSSGTSDCTTSPCTTVTQYGSLASSTVRNSQGSYTVNFNGSFAAPGPTCTCGPFAQSGNGFCQIFPATTNSVVVRTLTSTSNLADGGASIICIGTRP